MLKDCQKLILAPLAGYTDYPFRLLARENGADEVVTELVSANAIVRNNKKTLQIMRLYENERPASIQIFGSDPVVMGEAAVIAEQYSPLFIDINMGCPVRKVRSNGAGSALLDRPDIAGKIVKSVVDSVKKTPVSVKIRTGKSSENKSGLVVALLAEEFGATRITVHARTVLDGFNGPVDYDFVADLKKKVKVEVIGNGGITSLEQARTWLETGCDGLMIGRGAVGRPSIFHAIRAGMETFPPEKVETVIRHIDLVEQHLGQKGMGPMRAHLVYYSKGFGNAKSFRREVLAARSFAEWRTVVTEYMEVNAENYAAGALEGDFPSEMDRMEVANG
ncbi:MAG: tRNA-dihydrouridine synthase [Nitrospinae bacterium]|nr:tRNA-dihydrouridine synthase [Nitrospinota bacterium]